MQINRIFAKSVENLPGLELSDFIPNSFQVPNILIDQLMRAMSPLEFCCLVLIIRKTRGWHKDFDAIALSQFKQYTGVNRDKTIRAAIESLRKRGFIRIRKQKGRINEYELTGLFMGDTTRGKIATSGKIARGENAPRLGANLPPTKNNTKNKEADEQLIELGRNVGLIKNEFETTADFRVRVVEEMSRRRFDVMQG